jgi:site-specific DNA-methyltransferase (adenine-specific)
MGKELLGSIELNRIYQMDCLEGMKLIPDKSIDMILCDLPYGTTSCKWDTIIPFEPLWKQYERIIKDNGVITLTASQPFTSALAMSNIKIFRYQWYWIKNRITGFANAKKQPLRNIEDILVFYKKLPTYNPQGLQRINKKCKNGKSVGGETLRADIKESAGKGKLRTEGSEYIQEFTGYPKQTLTDIPEEKKIHPTQKPVALFEYLIKTYTNEGNIILDNCIGSGTTAVACTLNNRKWIGFETDSKYIELANKRLEQINLESDLEIYE